MELLISTLGAEIQDADEETFDLFSQSLPSRDLGMIDAKAERLQLSISDADLEVKQSPGILQSKREGGTTGAAVWQASVQLAEWFAWPKNFLRTIHLNADSNVIELGSGISGLVPLMLRAYVKRVVATDQVYLLKALQENIAHNLPALIKSSRKGRGVQDRRAQKQHTGDKSNVDVLSLDWENDDKPSFLKANGLDTGVDMVVACDCIFNYALIDPLVQTCLDICKFRKAESEESNPPQHPTICVICQQLRQPDVFSEWLEMFHKYFRVWRVPDELLIDSLKANSGFAVHIGVLRD